LAMVRTMNCLASLVHHGSNVAESFDAVENPNLYQKGTPSSLAMSLFVVLVVPENQFYPRW